MVRPFVLHRHAAGLLAIASFVALLCAPATALVSPVRLMKHPAADLGAVTAHLGVGLHLGIAERAEHANHHRAAQKNNKHEEAKDSVAEVARSGVTSVSQFGGLKQHGNILTLGNDAVKIDRSDIVKDGTFAPVPEPATFVLLTVGLIGLVAGRRKAGAQSIAPTMV